MQFRSLVCPHMHSPRHLLIRECTTFVTLNQQKYFYFSHLSGSSIISKRNITGKRENVVLLNVYIFIFCFTETSIRYFCVFIIRLRLKYIIDIYITIPSWNNLIIMPTSLINFCLCFNCCVSSLLYLHTPKADWHSWTRATKFFPNSKIN